MKHIRLCVLGVLAVLLIVGPLSGIVAARNYEQINYSFESQLAFELEADDVGTVNSGNYSAGAEFKNVLSSNGFNTNGIYWGNMFPPYRINRFTNGAYLHFSYSYNFTKQDLQFGASDYWIRVPVVGSQASAVYVYKGLKNYDINISWGSEQDFIGSFDYRETERSIFDDSGVYINMLYPLLPGNRSFTFIVKPRDFGEIGYYLSNERYNLFEDNITSFQRELKSNPGGLVWDYGNVITDYLPSSLAISFLFVNGVDSNGHSSIKVRAGETIERFLAVNDTKNNTFPSIYLPFRSQGAVRFEITWTFLDDIFQFNGGRTTNVTLSNEKDFVITSTPFQIVGTNGSASTTMVVYIRPLSDILVITTLNDLYFFVDKITDNRTFTRGYNVFCIQEFLNGQWARTAVYGGVAYVDYGWASGYKFPGETEVYIFLDTGASVFYDGPVSDFWKWLLEEEYTFNQAIKDGIKGAVGYLADTYLKNVVKTVNRGIDFVSNFLGNFINMLKKAWKFLENVLDYFDSMFRILPYFLLIVVLQYTCYRLSKNKKGEEAPQ